MAEGGEKSFSYFNLNGAPKLNGAKTDITANWCLYALLLTFANEAQNLINTLNSVYVKFGFMGLCLSRPRR